ncbi:hypothetical protein [Tautonia sociabilis]|uniref:Uncharacterized protein n=1 Tax=Tautonia sociabilis TaxID=2080755 RepID=A0A432MFH3_9BACT|nr:hypothetical protein [Tautonia sociabilis]RUL84978.1 hypothetical protein TsocGM_19220 [Tautonia sociabilis]
MTETTPAPPRLPRFTVGRLMGLIVLAALVGAQPLLIFPMAGVLLFILLRRSGAATPVAVALGLASVPLLAFLCLVGVLFVMSTPARSDAEYHALGRRLADLPGVTVVDSWAHEDLTLEDCGFTLQVRDCPPVRVDFFDGHDWSGQFRSIDGVVVRKRNRPDLRLPVDDLAARGLPIRNLADVLARLEDLLGAADLASSTGEGPPQSGRWVVLTDPTGTGLP